MKREIIRDDATQGLLKTLGGIVTSPLARDAIEGVMKWISQAVGSRELPGR